MKHFSIVFPLTVMAFCMGLSLVTYSDKAHRGVASVEQSNQGPVFHFYDASYKL